jgi:uncharacterized membrane protein YdjX (TVP38/TMEM64 family)
MQTRLFSLAHHAYSAANQGQRMMTRQLMRLAPLAILLAGTAAFFALGLHRALDVAEWAARADALSAFAGAHLAIALAGYFAVFVITVALCLPTSAPLTIAAGFVFGPWIGVPLSIAGAAIGSTLFFLLARGALGRYLHARARGAIARLEEGFRQDAFNYLLALRLAPVAPLSVTNLAAGLLDVRTKDFVLATILGLIPVTLVLTWTGASLRHALAAGAAVDPARAVQATLFSPPMLGALAALTALSLAPVALKRLGLFRSD